MLNQVNHETIFPFLEKVATNYQISVDELRDLWTDLTKQQIHPTSQYYKVYQKKMNKQAKPWRQLTARQQSTFRQKQMKDLQEKLTQNSEEIHLIRSYVKKKYSQTPIAELRELIKKNYDIDATDFSMEQCLSSILEHDFEVK